MDRKVFDMSTQVLGLDKAQMDSLAKDFSQELIQFEKPQPDGFKPRTIAWEYVAGRLNEVFFGGWSFEILRWEWLQEQVLVHGRLRIQLVTQCDIGQFHRWELTKDGVGGWFYSMVNGQRSNPSYDLNSAASTALKRAAVLLGVAIQLYHKDLDVVQHPAGLIPAPPAQQLQDLAQPFQVAHIKKYFEDQCKLPTQTWLQGLGIADPSHLTQSMVADILACKHPFVQRLVNPTGGVQTTNA